MNRHLCAAEEDEESEIVESESEEDTSQQERYAAVLERYGLKDEKWAAYEMLDEKDEDGESKLQREIEVVLKKYSDPTRIQKLRSRNKDVTKEFHADLAAARVRLRVRSTSFEKSIMHPDGNIYRAFAVGAPMSARVLGVTINVILLQLFAPVVVHFWGYRQMRGSRLVSTWTIVVHNESTVPSNGGVESITYMAKVLGNRSEYFWENDVFWEEVQAKIVGLLFMLLIFNINDRLLLRAYNHSTRIRELFPSATRDEGWWWMFTDAVCKIWTVVLVGGVMNSVFLVTEDVFQMILDAFGLLFLIHMDDLSGIIDYGIEASEFDKLVETEKERVENEKKRIEDEKDTENGEVQAPHTQMKTGEVFYTIARVVNHLYTCFFLFFFAAHRVQECSEHDEEKCPRRPLRDALFDIDNEWFYCGLAFFLIWFLVRSLNFCRHLKDCNGNSRFSERRRDINAGKGDFLAFVQIVILRIPDRRIGAVNFE